jgi:hypothetical protein
MTAPAECYGGVFTDDEDVMHTNILLNTNRSTLPTEKALSNKTNDRI